LAAEAAAAVGGGAEVGGGKKKAAIMAAGGEEAGGGEEGRGALGMGEEAVEGEGGEDEVRPLARKAAELQDVDSAFSFPSASQQSCCRVCLVYINPDAVKL
jgi:hypothetical protein